ncbi:HIT family protein [Candidatus Uhrbacteria bacterium CG10_big_fil_rev_8_21_14_0_10_48_11]|uniref:HIT family protein n=1 Tax=Candidatus Uhrbacteria bacterium CG10_big_fil_rev_8_21_14_0_10_48_11 TaxID=1975037 RepID=A0A2M8LEG7_9BACT|nr:MAG: HIT family protein [Candidatus Uhrbacteria bacterium CG10_big_fil_rev_8_21_14_0_10_48_11]
MEECIFCKIVAEEIPSTKIYEDDAVVAFLDIQPIRPGHTLLIPKEHSDTLLQLSIQTLAALTSRLQLIAKAVMEGANAEAFNITLNNGKASGQLVFHTHFHIIPRKTDDGLQPWQHHKYAEGEAETIAKNIRAAVGIDK